MTRRVFVDTLGTLSRIYVMILLRYDEVYVDGSLFPNMCPQLKALIDNGVRVFYFAWPWKWRELREKYAEKLRRKFGKKKTDYGDAYILSMIYEKPKAFKDYVSRPERT